MIGTIIGDIVGSRFEFNNIKSKEFELWTADSKFTDDTVVTCSIANALIVTDNALSRGSIDIEDYYKELQNNIIINMQFYGRRHFNVGYGGMFKKWILSVAPRPYGSYGNGAAMRISGLFDRNEGNLENLFKLGELSANITHNHKDSIKAVRAIIEAMYEASRGSDKAKIAEHMKKYYNIEFTLDSIRDDYKFNVSCEGSVPQAIVAFLESVSFEDAIRNAVSIGGDSDTIAAITGSIAEQYYGVPLDMYNKAKSILSPDLLKMVELWEIKYESNVIQ